MLTDDYNDIIDARNGFSTTILVKNVIYMWLLDYL